MANAMTKTQFAAAISAKPGSSKREAEDFLAALNSVVMEELKASGQVTIPGLLKLKLSERAAQPERPGKNPFTGEPIIIKAKPARRVVKAAPIKALKDAV